MTSLYIYTLELDCNIAFELNIMYSTVSQKYKNEKTRNVFCGYWIYNGCPSYLILDRQITIRQAGALLKISDTIHVWGHFKIMCGTNDFDTNEAV